MKKIHLYGIVLPLLCMIMGACSDKETSGSVFPEAAFILQSERQDTLKLTGFGTREIYLYYGHGVASSYQTAVAWETSDAGIVTVRNYGRSVRGDSCFSIASVTPTDKEGMAYIKVTLTRDGAQQSLQLPVTTNGMEGIDLSTLPEGAFADTVGKSAFAMIPVKGDTTINVGERWGIERDTSSWVRIEITQKKKDSLYEVWRRKYYDLWKWNEDSVYIPDLYVGQKEVTIGLWREVMGSVPDRNKEESKWRFDYYNYNYPISAASFPECEQFIEKLRERTGLPYRLLTHAEYQFICEGGRTGTPLLYNKQEPNHLGLYYVGANYKYTHDVDEWSEGKFYYYYSDFYHTDTIGPDGHFVWFRYDTILECRPTLHVSTPRVISTFNTGSCNPDLPDLVHPAYIKRYAGLRIAITAADWRRLKGSK